MHGSKSAAILLRKDFGQKHVRNSYKELINPKCVWDLDNFQMEFNANLLLGMQSFWDIDQYLDVMCIDC